MVNSIKENNSTGIRYLAEKKFKQQKIKYAILNAAAMAMNIFLSLDIKSLVPAPDA